MPPSTSGRSQYTTPLQDITNSPIKTHPIRPAVKGLGSPLDGVTSTKNLRPAVKYSKSSPDGVPSIEELRLRLAQGRRPNLQQSYSTPGPKKNMDGQNTAKPVGSAVSPSSNPSTPSLLRFSQVIEPDFGSVFSPIFTGGANASKSVIVSELSTILSALLLAEEREPIVIHSLFIVHIKAN